MDKNIRDSSEEKAAHFWSDAIKTNIHIELTDNGKVTSDHKHNDFTIIFV
jgi:hypothetical protein